MDGMERFRGPVVAAGQPGYDEERGGFNLEGPHQPELIAGATCAEDVAEAVRYAAASGLPVAVQATGHGRRDRLRAGVLITTGMMRGLSVDAASQTARVEAGVPWSEVVAAAAEHGLAPRNGSSPGVSAVGYTLAGGLGLLGRTLGWAADHVRSLEVVTWDGRLQRVTAATDPELFRDLRGSGGAPGVVTAMKIELVPLTTVFGGALTFDGAHATQVLEAWLEWTRTAPQEATSSLGMITMPDLPVIPATLRGRDIVSVRLAMIGDEAAGTALARPLREMAPPLDDTLRVLPWTDSATIASDPPFAHPYHGTGVMLGSLEQEGMREILRGAGPDGPVSTVVQVNHLGGALAGTPESASVIGHRGAAYLLRLLSGVGDDGVAPIDRAHEAVVAALGTRVVGRSLGFQFGIHPQAQWDACFDPPDLSALRRRLPTWSPFRTEGTAFGSR